MKPGTQNQCTKACYGLHEAPKRWKEVRDKTLTCFVFQTDHVEYSLRQSTYHPSLWFVVRAPCQTMSKKVRLPDDSDLPDISVFGEHQHVAAFLAALTSNGVCLQSLQSKKTHLSIELSDSNLSFLFCAQPAAQRVVRRNEEECHMPCAQHRAYASLPGEDALHRHVGSSRNQKRVSV